MFLWLSEWNGSIPTALGRAQRALWPPCRGNIQTIIFRDFDVLRLKVIRHSKLIEYKSLQSVVFSGCLELDIPGIFTFLDGAGPFEDKEEIISNPGAASESYMKLISEGDQSWLYRMREIFAPKNPPSPRKVILLKNLINNENFQSAFVYSGDAAISILLSW